jgi:hypothetical protein
LAFEWTVIFIAGAGAHVYLRGSFIAQDRSTEARPALQ